MTMIADMQNARLGVIYLWQGVQVKSPILSTAVGGALGSTGAVLGALDVDFPVPDQAGDVAVAALAAGGGVERQTLWIRIKTWALEFVQKVWEKVRNTLGNVPEMAGHVRSIGVFIAGQVFAHAAPFIGAANGLISGLVKAGRAFIASLSNWRAGRGVSVKDGHPKTLLKGVEWGVKRALWEGLAEIAKSATSIGLNAASFGGAAIVDAVMACLQAAVKLVWRIAEYCILTTFINQAKNFWAIRDLDTAKHLDAEKFNDWLKPATQKVPVIAALSLGSGIAGDKMRLLQMYNKKDDPISQSQFDRGVTYIDQLKGEGARLIKKSGLEFSGTNTFIDGLIEHAQSHDPIIFPRSSYLTAVLRSARKRVGKNLATARNTVMQSFKKAA